MEQLTERIEKLKSRLDDLRATEDELLPPDLQRSKDIELTYSSNAIEGNTLTLDETADIIEHGITVGGKKIGELFEAVDHYDAVRWMRGVATEGKPLSEDTVTELHRRIVLNSRKEIAGIYSQNARRIYGSDVVFPNPVKIPQLMGELGVHLAGADPTPQAAFDAHHRLVTIHPFDDGNGRTTRLLMNLMLLRGGYPPISIGPSDRQRYLSTIRKAQVAQDQSARDFHQFMHEKLAATMEEYVDDLQQGEEARRGQPDNRMSPEQLAIWRSQQDRDI